MEIKIVGNRSNIISPEPTPRLKPIKQTKQRLPVGVTIVTRGPKASDIPFVLDSAMESLKRYSSTIWLGWDERNIRPYLKSTLMRALTSGQFTMLVACRSDDEDQIAGYIVGNTSRNEILIQYTRSDFRRLNVQKHSLLPFIVSPTKPIYMQYPTIEVMKLVRKTKNLPGRVIVKDFMNEYAWDCFELYQQTLNKEQAA